MADDELISELAGPRQLKEPGSPAWCAQTVRYLKDHVRHVDEQWRQAEQILEDLKKFRAWDLIPPGEPYGTLNKMLKAEVGLDSTALRKAIEKAALATHGGDRRSSSFQGDNITLKSGDRGTSKEDAIRRLRRDRPDLADRVDRKELTANAAAIEAGFRPKTVSVRVSDPVSAAGTLCRAMSPEDLAELVRLLTQ